jgi:hypothetical protein
MPVFKGLVFVKHGRVGTKNEGPDYFLQTRQGDVLLQYAERKPWETDSKLESYGRKMVQIEGESVDNILHVKSIVEILTPHIPE